MNSSKRIEALEAQIRELNAVVNRLLEERGETRSSVSLQPSAFSLQPPEAPTEREGSKPKAEANRPDGVRRRVDRAFRMESDETIESHIGEVWLSRLAVVVLMTAIALGARTTFTTAAIGPPEKALIGYAMAFAFTAYGLLFRKRRDLFSQAVLGCGLAGLYFTTYAIFFIEPMRISDERMLGLPLALGCLGLLAVVAHWRKSQTVAGIGLFLAYYTVVVSCSQAPTIENLAHALFTCTMLAVFTLLFHFAHRWILFSWAALIATHFTYVWFFWRQPEGLELPETTYFWLSNGFLTVCFILFSLTCIVDARKTGEYRRNVAPLSGVNSAIFLIITYLAIREHYPEQQWMFRAAVAALFLLFAVLAETAGPRRNYLFQIYIAKMVIMVTLALQAYLAERGEILLVAMSIECLGLAFSYKRSGIVIFKVLGLLLMGLTFAGCLAAVRIAGTMPIGGYTIPKNWFSAVGVAFFFIIVAWFYEKFVRRLRPRLRVSSGQWFMSDTFLDLRSPSLAITHAAAASFILLTITILECGDDVMLPYLLAGEGLIMASLGLILLTPQVEVASVLLLAASHVCFHIFLWFPVFGIQWLPVEGFEEQNNYVLYTGLLALFTYVGAHAWERYLARYRHPEAEWEHHLVAAIPYLAATFMLATLIGRRMDPVYVPAVQGALGVALLLIGRLTRYPGVKASGIFALGLGAASLVRGIYDSGAPITKAPDFLLHFGLFLGTCAASERLLVILQRQEAWSRKLEDGLRTLLVLLIVCLGVLGFFEWCSKDAFIFYVLGLAVILISFGAVFRESRYRWGALVLFAIIIGRAFLYLRLLSPVYQVLSFGVSAVVLLVVSWAYSHGRQKAAQARGDHPPQGASSDG